MFFSGSLQVSGLSGSAEAASSSNESSIPAEQNRFLPLVWDSSRTVFLAKGFPFDDSLSYIG